MGRSSRFSRQIRHANRHHTKAGGRSAPGTTSVPIDNSEFVAVTVSFDYPNRMEFHRVTNDDAYMGAIKAWKNRLYKSKRLASY